MQRDDAAHCGVAQFPPLAGISDCAFQRLSYSEVLHIDNKSMAWVVWIDIVRSTL